MAGMMVAMLIWTAVSFALGVFVARWIFRVNKVVELLEEISGKMNFPQKHVTPEKVNWDELMDKKPAAQEKDDERYKPKF